MRRPLLALALVVWAAAAASGTATAQSVLVLWGDSLICGYGADAREGTPYGPAPFGDPVPGAWRWSERDQTWIPLTAQQNHQGTGADLAYGAAAAWLWLHRSSGRSASVPGGLHSGGNAGEQVYVVALGIPGADVSPEMDRPNASWAPGVEGGALDRFVERSLRPALASLPAPRVEWICGSAGNNAVRDWAEFPADLGATVGALRALVPGAPRTLMLRSHRPRDLEARLAIEQSGHGVVDLDLLPRRIDAVLGDGVHLTHYGNVCAGHRVALTAVLMPLPEPAPALPAPAAPGEGGPPSAGPGSPVAGLPGPGGRNVGTAGERSPRTLGG